MIGLKILSFTSHIHVLVCLFELFLFSCLNPKHFLATTMMRPVPHTLNSFKWAIYGVKCVSVWWWMLLFTTHPRGLLAAKDWVDAIFPLDLAHKRRAAGHQTKKGEEKLFSLVVKRLNLLRTATVFTGGGLKETGRQVLASWRIVCFRSFAGDKSVWVWVEQDEWFTHYDFLRVADWTCVENITIIEEISVYCAG